HTNIRFNAAHYHDELFSRILSRELSISLPAPRLGGLISIAVNETDCPKGAHMYDELRTNLWGEGMSHTDYTNRFAIDPGTAAAFIPEKWREIFLLPPLFVPGRIQLHYTNYDRMIVGGAMPLGTALELETIKPVGTDRLLARRELIAVNIGGA